MITFNDIMDMAEQAQKAGIDTEDVNFWKRKKEIRKSLPRRQGTETITCLWCGEIVEGVREQQKYCSKSCSTKAWQEMAKERHAKNYKPKKRETSADKIIKYIEENNLITIKELSKKTGITNRAVTVNIKKLKEKGLLERVGDNRKGHWIVKRGDEK